MIVMCHRKSLKMLKGSSKSVNRRTDNTMAKRKRTNSHLHNTTQKTKDPATQTPLKGGVNSNAPEV
jgi:hypothetical protein